MMVLCLSSDLESFAKVLVSFGQRRLIWVNMIMIALRLCALGKFATEVKVPSQGLKSVLHYVGVSYYW